jgi:dynein heavy chain
VLRTDQKDLARIIESCLINGIPILLEDVGETLPSVVFPLLSQAFVDVGQERIALKLGEQLVDVDKNFKLFITTKMANPHYLPDTTIHVTLINFIVTVDGLKQ